MLYKDGWDFIFLSLKLSLGWGTWHMEGCTNKWEHKTVFFFFLFGVTLTPKLAQPSITHSHSIVVIPLSHISLLLPTNVGHCTTSCSEHPWPRFWKSPARMIV